MSFYDFGRFVVLAWRSDQPNGAQKRSRILLEGGPEGAERYERVMNKGGKAQNIGNAPRKAKGRRGCVRKESNGV